MPIAVFCVRNKHCNWNVDFNTIESMADCFHQSLMSWAIVQVVDCIVQLDRPLRVAHSSFMLPPPPAVILMIAFCYFNLFKISLMCCTLLFYVPTSPCCYFVILIFLKYL